VPGNAARAQLRLATVAVPTIQAVSAIESTGPPLGQVFVPGGLPSVTYNPRESLRLEEQVRDYLGERHKILSLSGPTKSGKTVLLKRVVQNPLWLSGGSIGSAEDFWTGVVDKLGVYTNESAETSKVESAEDTMGVRGGAGIPNVAYVEGSTSGATGATEGRTRVLGRTRPAMRVAMAELRSAFPPLVVDDFHYIDPNVQLTIVRNLKELIFDGLPVIFASVPHRAFDAVRVEKEMTGRLEQLPIKFWSEDELRGIAIQGFDALNVTAEDSLVVRLARQSFQSPHLMQDFCLQLCKANGIRERTVEPTPIGSPSDWNDFFRARASVTSKAAFDLLATGPRQRTDRLKRVLTDGRETDIYGAVLAAIAATGPLTELAYTEVRASLRDVMASDPPQRHEVTRVLEEMSKIARDKIEGEPVVDYDEELSTLYISDPFFAYFLRWGAAGTERGGSAA
jgi:CBS domain-containing protein